MGRRTSTPRPKRAEAAHESSGEDANPLKIEPALAFWTLVVFVLLLVVLGRFAWKPLLAALHNREKHLEHVLLETERGATKAKQHLPSTAG